MSAACRRFRVASLLPRFSTRTKRGADIVKVFPATALGPQLHQGRARAAAAAEADADRRRVARQRRRLDSRRRGRGRRRVLAARRAAIESGRFDVITANARRIVDNVARREAGI